MRWEEIKKLEITKQIKIINKLIQEHGSITKAAKILGVTDKPIRNHFEKNGFSFDKVEKIYYKNTNTQLEGQTSLIEPIDVNKQDNTNILETITDINIDTLKTFIEQIVETKVSNMLEAHLDQDKPNTNRIEISSKCDGKVKYRSYGVYQTIADEFDKYVEDHPRFTKVELTSQALLFFMQTFQ